MIIGDRLRALREEKKLSQGDIEKRTGLLRCYISRVENDHTVPAMETLEKFARALEVPLYQLFYATRPGVLATPYDMDDARLAGTIPMAIVGIVPCKVSAESGPLQRGDLLVSSSILGHAMKGTDRARMLGAIVGKALEPFDPRDAQGKPVRNATGIIHVLVTLQ